MDTPSSIDANCKQEPGAFMPVIDRNRCEGKAQCVTVCPYNVFVVDVLGKELRTGLTLRGKIKGFAHGWRQALTANADACHACGLCVAACPEQAISLARV
jgi:4Fe-4S ferredoxin